LAELIRPFADTVRETGPTAVLPHNIEAEQAVLGAILIDNEAHDRVSDFLLPDHFYEPLHGRLYDACRSLIHKGLIATPVTLKTYFEGDAGLVEVGGAAYLARLAAAAVSVFNAVHYGREIYEMALRRDLIRIGDEMMARAHQASLDEQASHQIEKAEQELYNLADKGRRDRGFQGFHLALQGAIDMAQHAYQRDGKLAGLSTGFADLDGMLGGLRPSDLVILAARPSMGKTALATNIAFNVARAFKQEPGENGEMVTTDGGAVGFFSLEMSSEQLATRILAEHSEIDSKLILTGKTSEDQFYRLIQASQDLESIPLHIDDTPALSISALTARARRLKRQKGLDLIVVDYLQLIRPANAGRNDNRVQEVSEVTQGLKALAKELSVPVVALSQLSRAVESREDKRPQLSDLRESGSIEQDADVVMFIFREEYYHLRTRPAQRLEETGDPEWLEWQKKLDEIRGIAEILIAKQRNGPVGTVPLLFNSSLTKFANLARSDRYPDRH